MQMDMHYYGTYCLARAAGLTRARAQIIASASQYVDDAAQRMHLDFQDGAMLVAKATAHHMMNIKNLSKRDQRQVWVPFHFLPGNEGDTFSERLLCRKDSSVAQTVLKVNLAKAKQVDYGDALIGVTAHVYADTFAHYDFSGVSSRLNRADEILDTNLDSFAEVQTYIRTKKESFFKEHGLYGGLLANIKGFFGEKLSGALGHGSAATYPDRPYLQWRLDWEDPRGRSELRSNPETYLEACENLFNYFCQYAAHLDDSEQSQSFAAIKVAIETILAVKEDKKGRISAWQSAAHAGVFGAEENIPDYLGDTWSQDFVRLARREDSLSASEEEVVRFYQASAFHRVHVLRDLLPSLGLIVG